VKTKTGIYKITNTANDKFYIGQSRNIYNRFKQHTMQLSNENLPTSRIRMAFKKYGLDKIVYNEGKYGNFIFEVIEECPEDKLLERELYYIETLNPQYNCMVTTDPVAYLGKRKNRESKIWVQYHNCEKMKGYPAMDIFNRIENPLLIDSTHYITTRKRDLLYATGDQLFMIIGKKHKFGKLYFLWTRTLLDSIEIVDHDNDNRVLWALGDQEFVYPPQLLNGVVGFNEFLKVVGNFCLGLTSIRSHPFSKTLEASYNTNKYCEGDITFKQYIKEIEKTCANYGI